MKTVVVTGASQGLGLHIATAFLKKDWQVVGTGRSARPDTLNAAINYQQFDASDAQACANFWKKLEAGDGEVCLVNNAGGYVGGSLLDTSPEDYEKQIQSNYFSSVYMTRGLVENIASARIININSNGALAAHANNSAYGAAKAAAKQFFQSLQKELPPEKYQITNLYPSNIDSYGTVPDAIEPDDLAGLIVELAESQASYYPTDMTLFPVK
jgi:NAD(P)-dependent dehydrogenase (short-subunit alcohol dehydrogenase family)